MGCTMSNSPLKPLVDLGDAFNVLAPHNVLATLMSGRQSISTTPVLARQLTMYEEMNRVIPQERIYEPQPEPYVPPAQPMRQTSAFDALLALAPHNVLAALLTGGQFEMPPGFKLPTGANIPEGFEPPPPGTTLRSLGATLGGAAGWRFNDNVGLYHSGDSVTVKAPADKKIAVAIRPMINVKTYDFEDTMWVKGNPKSSGNVMDWSPEPAPESPPTVEEIPRGQTRTYTLPKDHTIDYKKLGTTALGFGYNYGVATEKDRDKYIELIGIEAEVGAKKPGVPGALPTIEGISALKRQFLLEIDSCINGAPSKLSAMDADVLQAQGYNNYVQNALSSLSGANQTGQAPAMLPLFAGSALPLFSGGALPFPFPLFGGGQIGAAASQVSTLTSLAAKSYTLMGQINTDAQAAKTASTNLQTYRDDVFGAKNKTELQTSHNNAKAACSEIATKTDSVSRKVETLKGYSMSAETAYDQGSQKLQHPTGVGEGAEKKLVDGMLMTKEQALQRAQFFIDNGDYSHAAAIYAAVGVPYTGPQAGPVVPTGETPNIYWGGPNPPAGNYTRTDLMNKAASMKGSDPTTAIRIYDNLGETGKANAIRDRLASAQAAGQQAQQNVMELLAQARMLEAQGNYSGAAELYMKAGYPNLEDSANKKALSAEQKASAKSKAEQIARQVAAAKLAAAKKKKGVK
mgnify:CR=1 FL=1